MIKLFKNNIAWVIVIVLLGISIYQYLNKPEPIIDNRIKEYENVILELNKNFVVSICA